MIGPYPATEPGLEVPQPNKLGGASCAGMYIEFVKGCFWAHEVGRGDGPTHDDMLAAKWRWIKTANAWMTSDPLKALVYRAFASGVAAERLEGLYQERQAALAASCALESDIDVPAPPGCTYRPYQLAGIEYTFDKSAVLLADDMRLGKTIQAIGVINTFIDPKHVLIICPSTPKRNWERELRKWLVHKSLEVGVCDGKRNPQTPVLVINYDILHTHKEYLDSIVWDIIICDESHYLKTPTARRTKMVLGSTARGKKVPRLKTSFWLFMSGSQMFKTPVDLFTVLQVCDPEGLGASWWDFVHRYCDAKPGAYALDVSGASNLEELQFLMRTRFMCRRSKQDVVGDMPSNRQTVSLPRSGLVATLVKQERDEVEKNLKGFSALLKGVMSADAIDELLRDYSYLDGIQRDDTQAGDANITAVGNLAKIRRELAVAKTPMCIEFVKDLLDSEDKVVVFAHHKDVIKMFLDAFPGAAVVRGGMKDKDKDAEVIRFQTDPECRVFVGNIIAAGQAINLSVADVAVFVEISWVPSEVSQAEERIWDVLKTRPNTIYRLPVEGSLDEGMISVVERRQEDVNKVMNMQALTK